jgi:large subunit ribosomal protein L1
MDAAALTENIEAVVTKLEQTLKDGKQNLKSVYVKTTMGPSVRVI